MNHTNNYRNNGLRPGVAHGGSDYDGDTLSDNGIPGTSVLSLGGGSNSGRSQPRIRRRYDPTERLQVAERRKRGACRNCQRRKVKCTHNTPSQASTPSNLGLDDLNIEDPLNRYPPLPPDQIDSTIVGLQTQVPIRENFPELHPGGGSNYGEYPPYNLNDPFDTSNWLSHDVLEFLGPAKQNTSNDEDLTMESFPQNSDPKLRELESRLNKTVNTIEQSNEATMLPGNVNSYQSRSLADWNQHWSPAFVEQGMASQASEIGPKILTRDVGMAQGHSRHKRNTSGTPSPAFRRRRPAMLLDRNTLPVGPNTPQNHRGQSSRYRGGQGRDYFASNQVFMDSPSEAFSSERKYQSNFITEVQPPAGDDQSKTWAQIASSSSSLPSRPTHKHSHSSPSPILSQQQHETLVHRNSTGNGPSIVISRPSNQASRGSSYQSYSDVVARGASQGTQQIYSHRHSTTHNSEMASRGHGSYMSKNSAVARQQQNAYATSPPSGDRRRAQPVTQQRNFNASQNSPHDMRSGNPSQRNQYSTPSNNAQQQYVGGDLTQEASYFAQEAGYFAQQTFSQLPSSDKFGGSGQALSFDGFGRPRMLSYAYGAGFPNYGTPDSQQIDHVPQHVSDIGSEGPSHFSGESNLNTMMAMGIETMDTEGIDETDKDNDQVDISQYVVGFSDDELYDEMGTVG